MSRNVALILAAVLGGVVVGGIVWFAKPVVAPASQPARAPAPASTVAPITPGAIDAAQTQRPPWADASQDATGPSRTSVAGAISASSRDPGKAQEREAIRQRLVELTAGGRHPTPAELNDVLADLERNAGSPIVAGVNIGALRSNLAAVDKLQKLGLELQAETRKPGGGDKQKIESILEQLRQVQSGMDLGVAVPPPQTTPSR